MPRRVTSSRVALTALLVVLPTALLVVLPAREALADGEGLQGFPSWEERVHHQLLNRARVDPTVELAACTECADAACYTPQPPLRYDLDLGHAARFHADEMTHQGFADHPSICTLVDDIAALYPDACDGSAACACVGGQIGCMPTCTDAADRTKRWNDSWSGEVIASGADPEEAFYAWLHQPTADEACAATDANADRWLLLGAQGSVGFGVAGHHVGEFGDGGAGSPIASGVHWPRQSATVQAWANWSAPAAPLVAELNLEGTCQPLALERGAADNGAYKALLIGVGGGCHRYYFHFVDADENEYTYPSTGTLGIGAEDKCSIWAPNRPFAADGCWKPQVPCTPDCTDHECGDDGCGGSCGTCPPDLECLDGYTCQDPYPGEITGEPPYNPCNNFDCGVIDSVLCGCLVGNTCIDGTCQPDPQDTVGDSLSAGSDSTAGGSAGDTGLAIDSRGCACTAGEPSGRALRSLLALPLLALARRRRPR